jgi:hypothetical protein
MGRNSKSQISPEQFLKGPSIELWFNVLELYYSGLVQGSNFGHVIPDEFFSVTHNSAICIQETKIKLESGFEQFSTVFLV